MISPAQQFVSTAPRAVRAFRIVYVILVLNFLIPAISYMARPELVLANVDQINRLLGGGPKYYKLGGAVRYDLGEVLRWIDAGARGGEATA